jgi:hypothetical protein
MTDQPVGHEVLQAYTAEQAGEILGVSARRVRALAQERQVGGKWAGGWVFTDADIELLRPGPTGRPRKVVK